MPLKDYLAEQTRVIVEMHRVLNSRGSICWQVGNFVKDGEIIPLDIPFYDIFSRLGFKLRNRIVWRFGHGLHANKRFSGRYETILWFTKGSDYVFNLDDVRISSKYPGKKHYKGPHKGAPSGNPNGKNPSDVWDLVAADWGSGVWDIPNVKANHPEKTIQPCQFPVELVERCVLALSRRGARVLDPYAGVGSTLIAAIKHGRRALGSEREAMYHKIALQRIRLLQQGKLKLRKLGTPIHEPTGREKVAQVPSEWSRKFRSRRSR
jgi:DNA modification methylase